MMPTKVSQDYDEGATAEYLGEYQPIYDEFGAVLVLIRTTVHRYDLTAHDLELSNDSFIARMLSRGNHSIPLKDLTEQQSRQLEGWIRGLYDSDKEGLGNEVFASCSPQDFYLLAPTLFSQTVAACSAGVLSLETVMGGLECEFLGRE